MEMLKTGERNVPERYIRLIQDVYQGRKTVVRSGAGESNSFAWRSDFTTACPVSAPDGYVDRQC